MVVIAIGNARAQTFAIISDYGSADTNESKVSQMVRGWNPEFIITAGDNFHKTLTSLETMIGHYYRWSFPNFFPAAGNHDITDPVNYYLNDVTYLTNFRDYFSWLPGNRRYYTVTKGDIQFFFFNSDFGGIASYCPNSRKVFEPHGVDSNSIQGQWLKGELNRSKAKFKIVVSHYPPYFSFPYDYDTTTTVNCSGVPYRLNVKVDTLFKSLRLPYKSWGADMVLNGHTHCGELLEVEGLKYYLQLSGGAPLGNWFANRNPHSKFFYKSDFGATLAKVQGDSINFVLKSLGNREQYQFSIFPQKSIRIKAKVKAGNDTITAKLRQPEMPYTVIDVAKRKLNNGQATFYFPNANRTDKYFLQVQHRNSVSVWYDSTITFGGEFDLTKFENVAGENIDESGFMFSGDVNQDRTIDGSDATLIDNDVQLYKSGYINSDLSGNNYTDIQDMIIIESNVTKFVTEIQP